MTRWVFLFSLLVIGLLAPLDCVAQMGTIRGFVYDAETNDPIAGASVDASIGEDWYWTDSLADGSYSLETASGLNEIEVWAQGYGVLMEEITVADGMTTSHDFYLQPLEDIALIQGTVKDCETDQPIRNAFVEVDTGEYTYTDGSGTYAMGSRIRAT